MNKVHKVMSEFKNKTLKSGSGQKVTSRKQAIAIALSEQRKKEEKDFLRVIKSKKSR